MGKTERLRSPHAKLQEFIDCFIETDHKQELENFKEPEKVGAMREEPPDEALRYLALVLLYAIDERAKDITISRKKPDESVVRMAGERFYELPPLKDEVSNLLFDELKEMTGMEEAKKKSRLVVGVRDSEIDLGISLQTTDAGGEKILIQLPQIS